MLVPLRSTDLLDSPRFNSSYNQSFLYNRQTPRCDGWGGCGWRDEKRQQRVFVKWLSGALGILAERDPLMGRQAGAVFGRPGDWWCTGLIQQTQILRSIMFSSQQLCWQNTRADSGAEMLRQNKPFESAAPMSFPLPGFVYVCISVFVCAYSLVSATRCVFKYKTIFQIDLLYIFVFKCWNIFVKFLRLYLQSTYTDDSECIFLYVMYVHLSECRSHTHTCTEKKEIVSIRLELCTADWLQEPFPLSRQHQAFALRREMSHTITDVFSCDSQH